MVLSVRVQFQLLCLLFLAVSANGTIAAEEGNDIKWVLTGLPPKLIPDGPLRGTGFGEQQVAFLSKHLPQFSHRLETASPSRLWHEMQTDKGVCSIDIADLPERETWAVFTRHRTSNPPFRLLLLQERVPDFAEFRDEDGMIDLDLLAKSDQFSGIYVSNRHYMPQVNHFIDDPSRKARLQSVISPTRIFEMVAKHRADFSFAAVTEMNYFNADTAAAATGGKPLAMLAIKGGTERVFGHIACSRDPLGLKLVEAVDRLLDQEGMWNEFLAPERRWEEQATFAGR